MTPDTLGRNARNVNRKYGEYFLPSLLTGMASNLAAIVDSALAGNLLGRDALGAIGLFLPLNQLLFAFTILLGMGGSTCMALLWGEGKREEADRVFTLCVGATALVGVLGGTAMLVFRAPVVAALSGTSGLNELVGGYYIPFAAGLPFNLLLGCFSYYIRLDGRPNFTTAILITSNVLNLCCDLLFMGVVKMGIFGAALSTDVGMAVGLIMVASHYLQKRNAAHWNGGVFRSGKEAGGLAAGVFSTGLSGALDTLLSSVRIQVFNLLCVALAGSAALSCFSVCNSSLILASMFITGAAQSMAPLVGVLAGEEDYPGVRSAFYRALLFLLTASVGVTALVAVFPGAILTIFGLPPGDEAARTALRLNAICFPFNSVVYLLMYLYMALGKKGMAALIASLNALVLAVPSALVLTRPLGINGVWLSGTVTGILTLAGVALTVTVLRKRRGEAELDLFLLPQRSGRELASLSMPATAQTAAGTGLYLEKLLTEELASPALAARLAYVTEGMVENIARRAGKEPVYLDLRVLAGEEKLTIILRDSGAPFDPTAPEAEEDKALPADVRAAAESVSYTSLLGWNRLTVEMRRETLWNC